MAPSTFEVAAGRNNGSIRKAVEGLVAVAPYETAALVTTLVATDGQINMPALFHSVGWISTDGATEAGDRNISDINGWGSAAPLRQDVTGSTATLAFTMLEDNRWTREVYDSVDLSALEVSTEGEATYEIDAQPDVKYFRAIVLGADGSGPTRRYFATAYHKCSVTAREDLVSANGDSAYARGVTLGAVPDDVTGTLATRFMFGPGALARATVEGYVLGS